MDENELWKIVAHFALPDKAGAIETIVPYGNGRINDTYLVTTKSGGRFILQRVNPIFAPTVLEDIGAITRIMQEKGFETPTLIPTIDGGLGVSDERGLWRLFTYVEGRTKEGGITEEEAYDAMRLVGRFHDKFAGHPYEFRHLRKGFHDTPLIMKYLRETVQEFSGTEKSTALLPLASKILAQYEETGVPWSDLPRRIIHGDLKLSNIRFANGAPRAVALLDLDTLGRHSIILDLADAARSWANTADEGDEEGASFNLDIFHAMMTGYKETAHFVTPEELTALPAGILAISLELAARFVTDAYRESYFKLDSARYPDLFTQNSEKARAQLALAKDVNNKLTEMEDAQ